MDTDGQVRNVKTLTYNIIRNELVIKAQKGVGMYAHTGLTYIEMKKHVQNVKV